MVPTLYWLGFRSLGTAGARRGLVLGLVHYLASGLLLGASEPASPKRRRGRGWPMGPLLSGYGPLEQAMNLLGHLGYGTLVGLATARRGARGWGCPCGSWKRPMASAAGSAPTSRDRVTARKPIGVHR